MSKLIEELKQYRNNKNIRLFLNMISAAEGTQKYGYSQGFGTDNRLSSLSAHPQIYYSFKQTDGKRNRTSAAGKYQITASTWKGLQKQHGFTDFGEESQDLAAIALLKENGALEHILKGDMRTAIQKAGKTWASLPSSTAPQHTRSWDFVLNHLKEERPKPSFGDQWRGSILNLANGNTQKSGLEWLKQPLKPTTPQTPMIYKNIDVLDDSANSYSPLDLSVFKNKIETENYNAEREKAMRRLENKESDDDAWFGKLPESISGFINSVLERF